MSRAKTPWLKIILFIIDLIIMIRYFNKIYYNSDFSSTYEAILCLTISVIFGAAMLLEIIGVGKILLYDDWIHNEIKSL